MTVLPWFIIKYKDSVCPDSPLLCVLQYPFIFGLSVALSWSLLVCVSRIYMGMHSVLVSLHLNRYKCVVQYDYNNFLNKQQEWLHLKKLYFSIEICICSINCSDLIHFSFITLLGCFTSRHNNYLQPQLFRNLLCSFMTKV